jgi:hypothetical protein
MSSYWYREKLSEMETVSNLSCDGEAWFTFRYTQKSGHLKVHKVYNPPRDEYVVGHEVVQRAIENGATAIVCDMWSQITSAGAQVGRNAGVAVLKGGQLLAIVRRGGKL